MAGALPLVVRSPRIYRRTDETCHYESSATQHTGEASRVMLADREQARTRDKEGVNVLPTMAAVGSLDVPPDLLVHVLAAPLARRHGRRLHAGPPSAPGTGRGVPPLPVRRPRYTLAHTAGRVEAARAWRAVPQTAERVDSRRRLPQSTEARG